MDEEKDYENKAIHSSSKIEILLFAIMLLLMVIIVVNSIMSIGRIYNIPTGNIDIFYIIGDESQKDILQEKKENISKENNNKKSENSLEGFYVTDKKVVWNTENTLNIFSNPAYQMRTVIAPESTNSYEFYLVNNNNFKLNYSANFMEKNSNNINMKFRLRKNGEFIKENENTWLTYEELNLSDIIINEYENDKYFLDWKWFESDNDTAIGTEINSNYSLLINLCAEQI